MSIDGEEVCNTMPRVEYSPVEKKRFRMSFSLVATIRCCTGSPIRFA